MKYAIIENEFYALENLKAVISKLRPDYKLIFTSESVAESVEYFNSNSDTIGLIFMDIELVDGNCFDIFERTSIDVPVIFTTAYNQFAILAFKQNSIDYLLKPISEELLLNALEKFEKHFASSEPKTDLKKIEHIFSERKDKKRILVNKGNDFSFMDVSDAAYFISEDKYILLVSFSGNRHITNYINLNQVEQNIDPYQFFRISRNMIVNITSIRKVSKYFNSRLIIYFGYNSTTINEVIISSARKEEFLKWLDGETE